jgi:hypothetical protein
MNEVLSVIWDKLEPKVIDAVVVVVGTLVSLVALKVRSYLAKKEALIAQQIGQDKLLEIKKFAVDLYYEMEQKYFKGAINNKKEEFIKKLKSKFPGLEEDTIETMLEAIVGAVNTQQGRLANNTAIKTDDLATPDPSANVGKEVITVIETQEKEGS